MYYYRIISLATRKVILETVDVEMLPTLLPQITEEHGAVILDPLAPDWWELD